MGLSKIGGLWLGTSKKNGKKYMNGTINGKRVVIFKNERKQPGEKFPDYEVFDGEDGQQKQGAKPDLRFTQDDKPDDLGEESAPF